MAKKRKNTNNTVPSNALADLNDNILVIDEWTNSTLDYTKDRLGRQFKTRHKIIADFQTTVDDIATGIEFLPRVEDAAMRDVIIEDKKLVIIDDDVAALVLETAAGDKSGFMICRESGDFKIVKSKQGEQSEVIALYTSDTDSLDFNVTQITHNTVPLVTTHQLPQFSGKIGANGWCQLGNGLILQWGQLYGQQAQSCFFPIPFPNTWLSLTGSAHDGQKKMGCRPISNAHFLFEPDHDDNGGTYIAIGY